MTPRGVHIHRGVTFNLSLRRECQSGIRNDSQVSVADRLNDEIARIATATGELFVATTKLRGETVIRLAIGNARTTEDDIRRSWEVAPILLGGGVTFRRLSPVPTPGVEFFESVYPPNSMSNAHGELLRHEGYEVGTVTAGNLTVDFDTDVVTLAVGDSITFPCSRPHLISNRSAVTAVATWLIVNPQ